MARTDAGLFAYEWLNGKGGAKRGLPPASFA